MQSPLYLPSYLFDIPSHFPLLSPPHLRTSSQDGDGTLELSEAKKAFRLFHVDKAAGE